VRPTSPRPLVVTAELDPDAFAWLDGLRRAHFPPERNLLAAHLTLFHALPDEEAGRVEADLVAAAADGPWEGTAVGWMLLGRGVALRVDAPGLQAVRARLRDGWAELLTRQDASGFRPHVTIQNKVTPDAARALESRLAARFAPRPVAFPALRLWRYAGGPWEPVARVPGG